MEQVIVKAIKKIIRPFVKKVNQYDSNQIPNYKLEPKHLKNAQLLINRESLLKLLPKNAVVAELGVDKGGFSENILKICDPKKLHLVDCWDSNRYNQNKRRLVEEKFSTEISSNKLEINLGLSTDVVSNFSDNYFDWIYIDTNHSYKTTIKELEMWHKKVKEGGIIAGHDYVKSNWDTWVRYGVIEAVYEFCNKYNWEIIYLTMDATINPSFAIQKIQ